MEIWLHFHVEDVNYLTSYYYANYYCTVNNEVVIFNRITHGYTFFTISTSYRYITLHDYLNKHAT